MAAVALVIGLSQVSTDSGAVAHGDSTVPRLLTATAPECPPGSKPSGVGCIDKHPVHIEYCLTARRGAAFYRARTWRLQRERGADLAARTPIVRGKSCHWARYAARVWHARAKAALKALEQWQQDEWNWQAWLPRLWYAIGMCETHLDWHFDSGTYVSAFGIIRSAFPTWNGKNSPREQYRVALGIAGRYGLNAWGCYSHGGYRYHL